MANAFDPVGLIEQSYVARANPVAWMREMAGPITRAMDPAADYTGVYTVGSSGPKDAFFVRTGNMSQAQLAADLIGSHHHYVGKGAQAILAAVRVPGMSSAVEVTGEGPQVGVASRHADAPTVVVHPVDRPPAVFITLSKSVFRIDAMQRALWRKLALHLGAGLRLSARGGASAEAADVELVLSTEGQVVHQRGSFVTQLVKERLKHELRAIDRARTRARRSDPHAALDLWQGLVCGRWSLVEFFDSDGKRLVLARRNDPEAYGPPNLSLRQRQVLFYVAIGLSNKEVAYALGIEESTVASHLARGLAGIGMPSRAAWIHLSAGLASVVIEALERRPSSAT